MEAGTRRSTYDWRPGQGTVLAWNVLAALLFLLGVVVFGLPVVARAGHGLSSGTVSISFASLLVLLVATGGLLVLHEGIHALLMRLFGARPSFGATMVAGLLPALYTTAPGHVFGRGQYLCVAVAPGVVLSTLGFLACLSAPGGYLVVPLAIHLAGCVGDAAVTERVLRQPPGTNCEDLRDGIRFYLPSSPRH
jgi:energy-converting hydrogenase Eha subunit A